MIRNDEQLEVTQKRLAYFYRLLAQLRVTADPREFPALASGYVAEAMLMQNEILEYLTRHAGQQSPTEIV